MEGVWLGHSNQSNEALVGTKAGVVKAWVIKQRPEGERWDMEAIKGMKGTPRKPVPGRAGFKVPIRIRFDEPPELEPEPSKEPRREVAPRRAKIQKKHFDIHGYAVDCAGCRHLQAGLPHRGHTEACRERMETLLQNSEEGRIGMERARKRHDQWVQDVMRYCEEYEVSQEREEPRSEEERGEERAGPVRASQRDPDERNNRGEKRTIEEDGRAEEDQNKRSLKGDKSTGDPQAQPEVMATDQNPSDSRKREVMDRAETEAIRKEKMRREEESREEKKTEAKQQMRNFSSAEAKPSEEEKAMELDLIRSILSIKKKQKAEIQCSRTMKEEAEKFGMKATEEKDELKEGGSVVKDILFWTIQDKKNTTYEQS